jgi:hypothetical protein
MAGWGIVFPKLFPKDTVGNQDSREVTEELGQAKAGYMLSFSLGFTLHALGRDKNFA